MKDFAKSIVCNTKAEVVKVGNIAADITTDGNTWFVTTSDGKKEEFPSEREAEEYVKKIKAGNQKVGNADILSGNYIILADNGEVWFRDEHENVHIRNIDSWAQKRIASYQSSIDEIKKGVAEAKQAAKKAGMI